MNNNLHLPSALTEKWQSLGFAPKAFRLLLLAPPVQTAWAEGFLQAAERRAIINFAENEVGISREDPEFDELEHWLDVRPPDELFEAMSEILGKWLEAMPKIGGKYWRAALLRTCLEVAQASTEIGLLRKSRPQIHREEREQIQEISRRLGIAPPDLIRQ